MSTDPVDVDATAVSEPDEHADTEPTQTEMGLDENVAGALTYLFGFVTGVVFYFVEKENQFVRFHAAQSIATFGLVALGAIGLTIVGTLVSLLVFTGSTSGFIAGSLVSLLLTLVWLAVMVGSFGLWVYLLVRAYQGETPRVPIAASIADRLL